MASGPIVCPACRVVLPERTRHCPACDARLIRRPPAAVLVLAALAIAAVIGGTVAAWPGIDPKLTAGVTATSTGFRPSADGRRTDATASLDNANAVPVDVFVRVQAYDHADRIVSDETIGPILKLAPGESRTIRHSLDLTPVQSVTFDVIEARPAASP